MVHTKRLTKLKAALTPVEMTDVMTEVGRKVLLQNFIEMLEREAGSRTGEDIEDVHKMRVATRRMRSAFLVFGDFYRNKPVRPFSERVKLTARALGAVRDLDVMIDDIEKYRAARNAETEADYISALQGLINKLDKQRRKARIALNDYLDSKPYEQFVKAFSKFLMTPDNGAARPLVGQEPVEVRHVAPVMVYQQLAAVRAYDSVIHADTEIETLHALRIEFKRLRYVVAFFQPVLGTSAEEFIEEIKEMQEYLGRLNDAEVAQARLMALKGLDDAQTAARDRYLADLQAEAEAKLNGFPEAWTRFNTRTVQRKMSDSLLVLR